MKALFSIGLFAVLLQSCIAQTIKVKAYNKTGYLLDSLYLGDIYVGRLQNDSSYSITDLHSLQLLNGLPARLSPWGNIRMNNWAKKGYHWLKGGVYSPVCGTGATEVKSGNYEFDIKIIERPEGLKLSWDVHSK